MSDIPPPSPPTSGPPPQAPPPRPAVPPPGQRLHTRARERRGRWPGLVWAIPIAALMVVAYLGLDALAHRGVIAYVTFKTSGGAVAGQTPVVYKGVTVGRVVGIQIAKNARDVEMKIRLEPRAKAHMRQGAKFWLIGAEPSLTDLSSLKSVVSGVSVGVSPGTGPPQDHFIGLSQPPAVPPDTPGTAYVVEGKQVGSTRPGSGIYYHGLIVGHVSRINVQDPQTIRLLIFVEAPYDRLVRPNSLFFSANAADVSLTAGHLAASIGPGSSVLTGGIEFDTPLEGPDRQSPPETVFHFYDTRFQAANQPRGPEFDYRATFTGATQQLQPDAPIWLGGVRVGRVLDAKVRLPTGARAPLTDVFLELEPQSLQLDTGPGARDAMNAAVRDLLAGGYRLQIGQYPPLIGGANLVFERTPGAPVAKLGAGLAPQIPTASQAGLQDVTAKLNSILAKADEVPIVQIGQDVRQITSHLSALVSSPELSDSLRHLDGSLTQVDQMVREVRPQVGPLVAKLNQTADQLSGLAGQARALMGGEGAPQDANLPAVLLQVDEAARSLRSLADYLGRNPNAIVSGKKPGS